MDSFFKFNPTIFMLTAIWTSGGSCDSWPQKRSPVRFVICTVTLNIRITFVEERRAGIMVSAEYLRFQTTVESFSEPSGRSACAYPPG